MAILANPQLTDGSGLPGGEALAATYRAVRDETERLASPLSAEDQTVQSMSDVSPTKWHRAHTSWFFETFLLGEYLPGYQPYHHLYGYLFNSYYEAVGDRYARPDRGLVSRPGVEEIRLYRRHVDDSMNRLLELELDERAASLVELGVHHEQQHQELLLMDIKHVLSMNPLSPAYAASAAHSSPGAIAPVSRPVAGHDPTIGTPPEISRRPTADQATGQEPAWLGHGGGLTEIGSSGGTFCFDNETPLHLVHLVPFELAARLATCGQWMDFMDDGGYRRPELWLSDGWAAVNAQGWTAPLYWRDEGPGWSVFTLAGRREVDRSEPVCHVSYYEADAFARWSGARLPTEQEWEAVASAHPVEGGFLETGPGTLHPRPQQGVALYGDAWAWTASAYLPYPRFKPAAGAVGEYNGKFMVNQHVLRGGCCVTPTGHLRPSYRNFFPPAARWPFTGVRLARDL